MATFYEDVLARYIGGTIVQVAVEENPDDGENPTVGLVVEMPNRARTIIWFAGNEEGNFPGVPEIQVIIPPVNLKLNIPHRDGN